MAEPEQVESKGPEPEASDAEGEEKVKAKRPKNIYRHMKEAWDVPAKSSYLDELQWSRLIGWRAGPSFVRLEHPTRLDRARELGYKAKQGYVVVRARVRRGGLQKHKIKGGRRAKRKGMNAITMKKNIRRIAEERVAKHYPNMEVLNSYWVGSDGRHKYYEVILVDPHHPVIKSDPKISWITHNSQHGRVFRGKTSAALKARGLRKSHT